MTDGPDPRARQREGCVLNEKWTLERLIGSGGMGDVYSARHRNGARAAIKVLHPELARLPEVRERFLREGYAANRVEHRGVVQVLDDDIVTGGPDDGSAYLVMELLDGESLQERSSRTPRLTERELLEVTDAVLDVLTAAHDHGVIHRDLKPENIFLARDPERDGVRVKLLDFGLARLVEAGGVTRAGTAVGTPSFMAPEQASGRSHDIDGRTDLFALGATLFRISSGHRIHEAENAVKLVVLMATTPAPLLRTVLPGVSDAFARIVDRALTFDREGRHPSARAMQTAVRGALDTLPVSDPSSSDDALRLIPSSTRNLQASGGGAPDIGADEANMKETRRPDPPPSEPETRAEIEGLPTVEIPRQSARDLAAVAKALQDTEKEAAREESASEPPSSAPSDPPPAARTIAQSATLPWVIVLVLLAIGAWKFSPSLQQELVRRSSGWTAAPPPTAPLPSETPPSTDAGAAAAAVTVPSVIVPPAEIDDAVDAEGIDAGAATNADDASRDSGAAPRPAPARPHSSGARPPRPPPKKPPVAPQPTPKHGTKPK